MKRISSVIAVLLTSGVVFSGAVFSDAASVNVADGTPISRSIGIQPNRDLMRRAIDTSSSAMLKRDADWLAAAGECASGTSAHLEFTGSYTQEKNNLVGYVKGTLFLKDGMLSGEGRQYFNDRTYKMPPPPSGTLPDGSHIIDTREYNPFNPNATDKLGLTIDPATGKAKIILLSWGGGTTEIQLEHKNGIFYGFPSNGGLQAFVFKRVEKSCIY